MEVARSAQQVVSDSHQILWVQGVTIVWMCAECTVALTAARQSRSTALFAFGSDSFVELLSACVVLLQFIPGFPLSERMAARLAAILLFLLCILVAISSIRALWLGTTAETSIAGMIITSCALFIMPVIAAIKRKKAREIKNYALAADAIQSATCAYLAAVTLAGLAINALFQIAWIDSIAALLATPILVNEGRRAWRGQTCACC